MKHHPRDTKEHTMASSRLADRYRAYYRDQHPKAAPGRSKLEAGYILAMTALLILPLLVAVSFAVDAGAWEAQASRIQRAADAAALAGVVRLPNANDAKAAAESVARQNGFSGAQVDARPDPTSATRYIVSVSAPAQRYFSSTFQAGSINLTRSATAEFNKPVPMGSPNDTLGTDPASCPRFQPVSSGCGSPSRPQTMLWSAIQSPYSAHQDGDPYATKCSGNDADVGTCGARNSSNAQNPDYKATGYAFAIEVGPADVGKTLNVDVWDVVQLSRTSGADKTLTGTISSGTNTFTRSSGSTFAGTDVGKQLVGAGIPTPTYITSVTTSPSNRATLSQNATTGGSRSVTVQADCVSASAINCQTGDATSGNQGSTGDRAAAPFQLEIFDNDGNDFSIGYDISLCEKYWPRTGANGTTDLALKNVWTPGCSFTATEPGIYPMRIKTSNITTGGSRVDDFGTGWNAFSLRVTGGVATRLYALDDLSIWTNLPGSNAQFYLAEIKPEHAGKRILLDLYDPGDGQSGTYTMEVKAPPSGAPAIVPTGGTSIPDGPKKIVESCKYTNASSNIKTRAGLAGATLAGAGCTVTTRNSSGNLYNEEWLRVEIKLSPDYTCTTDCWWSIQYDFGSGGTPYDRTVWSLQVVGDPVHLVD